MHGRSCGSLSRHRRRRQSRPRHDYGASRERKSLVICAPSAGQGCAPRSHPPPGRAGAPARCDMQLETHCIQHAQNGLEVWMLWTPCKSSIKARSFNSSFFRDGRDIVEMGDDANGLTNLGDVRRRKRTIEVIRRLARTRSRTDWQIFRFFGHTLSQKRPAFLLA